MVELQPKVRNSGRATTIGELQQKFIKTCRTVIKVRKDILENTIAMC